MPDQKMSRDALQNELIALRRRLVELESSEWNRQQALESLRESEERFRNLFEHAADAILVAEPGGRLVDVNIRACDGLGYSREELLALTVGDIWPSLDRATTDQVYSSLASGGGPVSLEGLCRRNDGSTFPAEIRCGLILLAGGQHMLALVRDITQRHLIEDELREANQTLRALIEASPLAIGVLDRDRKLQSWNKAGEQIFGWTEAEALAHPYPILSAEEDRDEALARQRRVLAGESLLGLELHHRRKDGSPVDVEVWAAPLRDTQGEISGGVVIYADITERKAAQEALRQAEEKYRSIFENSVEGIFQLTPEGQIISGNPALARIFGFESPEEITQLTRLELVYFHELTRLIREQGSVLGYEVQEERQDGSHIWVSISARAVYDQQGQLAYYEGTVQDITEHKLAEEALRESEERYRNLVETAQDVIYTMSLDGIITSLNPAFETMTGWPRSEWLGRLTNDLIHPDDLEPDTDLVQRFAQGDWPPSFERRVLTKSGKYLICEFLTTPQIRDGTLIGVFGIGRDITERKQAEQTLLEQTRELAVLEERNRFAREIHDTLAQGFTGIVLQLEAAEEALGGNAPEVQDHVARAKGLARDSLQEARRSVWDLLPQALEQLPLDAAIREEVRRRFNEQGSFSVSGEQRVLSSSVQTAILRICQEALTNVSRHAAATRVSVKMAFHPDAVHLEVWDNGIGFDRAGTGANHEPGSGFGLIGMEQRARQLGGTILVSSEKGKGTVVEARIPTA